MLTSNFFAFSLEGGSPQKAIQVFLIPEAEAPHDIKAERGEVYIADEESILVYSLESGQLLRRIGKRGQGPGEFLIIPGRLAIISDRLIVGDMRRILIFSCQGKYLSQVREPALLADYNFLPVGSNFVGFARERQEDGSFSEPKGYIYNQNGKILKQFYGEMPEGPPPPPPPGQIPAQKQDAPIIQDYADYTVYEDRIYVADSRKGLFVSVFNDQGELLYEINQPVEKIKVPSSFKDKYLKGVKARGSKYWEYFNPIVPEFFPAFVSFKMDAGKIYFITPAQKEGKYELLVLDLKGKILERSFRCPLDPFDYDFLELFNLSFDIEKDQLIWYRYNPEKEYYEICVY